DGGVDAGVTVVHAQVQECSAIRQVKEAAHDQGMILTPDRRDVDSQTWQSSSAFYPPRKSHHASL
ncbi:MAG: hypothetical protein WAM90_09830, partial [Rhodanobacter sp.]